MSAVQLKGRERNDEMIAGMIKKNIKKQELLCSPLVFINLWDAGSVTQTGFEASDYICAIRVLQTALLRMLITSTGCPIEEMKRFIIYKGNLY